MYTVGMSERLQKVLAARGVGPRRECELMIRDGRVTVNGQRVRKLPVLVDPAADDIRVDSRRIRAKQKVYYLLNKPKSVLCTASDPAGRTLAMDLLAGVTERVYPVGRLDADSQGLLVLTNDGEMTNRLTHPRYGAPKTYRAEIAGRISDESMQKLRKGVWLAEGRTEPIKIKRIHRGPNGSVLELTLREGRNRQVRRMLSRLGHPVRQLIRIRLGRLTLRGLGVGQFRPLTSAEIRHLKGIGERTNRVVADRPKRPAVRLGTKRRAATR